MAPFPWKITLWSVDENDEDGGLLCDQRDQFGFVPWGQIKNDAFSITVDTSGERSKLIFAVIQKIIQSHAFLPHPAKFDMCNENN